MDVNELRYVSPSPVVQDRYVRGLSVFLFSEPPEGGLDFVFLFSAGFSRWVSFSFSFVPCRSLLYVFLNQVIHPVRRLEMVVVVEPS